MRDQYHDEVVDTTSMIGKQGKYYKTVCYDCSAQFKDKEKAIAKAKAINCCNKHTEFMDQDKVNQIREEADSLADSRAFRQRIKEGMEDWTK